MVSHYLSLLHNEAKEELVRRYGNAMVETTTIDFVLTVPAVWSDTAKDATLRAANNAGLGPNLYMISEPEAAAIYALKSMEHHNLDAGDNFIVCDAGGGTVDLISYEICSLSPLRLQESVPGTGALCGGAFLNIRFENLVKNRMGSDLFEELCKRKPKSWETALNYFEDYVKRNFDPSSSTEDYDDNKFNVTLPGAGDNAEAGIDCGFLTLSTADVAEIFRPVIDQVIELVKNQKTLLSAHGKTAKGVILVGGFGKSNHLFKSLRTCFSDGDLPPPYSEVDGHSNSENGVPSFVVRQPANAWTAVVRGAVLNGLEGAKLVVSRKARRHYGVLCRRSYDSSIHSMSNKHWCPLSGSFKAEHQISWYVRKGQTLPSQEPILLGFHLRREDTNGEHATKLIVSDEDEAPREFAPDRQTRILCKINYDLQDFPRLRWKTVRATKKRTKHKRLDYEIGMKVEGGGIHFDCRIGGIVYGTARADFE